MQGKMEYSECRNLSEGLELSYKYTTRMITVCRIYDNSGKPTYYGLSFTGKE